MFQFHKTKSPGQAKPVMSAASNITPGGTTESQWGSRQYPA